MAKSMASALESFVQGEYVGFARSVVSGELCYGSDAELELYLVDSFLRGRDHVPDNVREVIGLQLRIRLEHVLRMTGMSLSVTTTNEMNYEAMVRAAH